MDPFNRTVVNECSEEAELLAAGYQQSIANNNQTTETLYASQIAPLVFQMLANDIRTVYLHFVEH